ncbi:MAG: PHP domain-containing protein, partial [Cyanobacteria bacterium J06638_22]
GYKNLVKLTTISHLQGVQGKGIFSRPCINKDLLEQYHEGLIVTSACLGGEVPQAILQKRPDVARRVAQWYKDLFGDDYYLEIQDHGSPEDRVVNVEILKIARELNIKVICTNDSHYISCNDVEAGGLLYEAQAGETVHIVVENDWPIDDRTFDLTISRVQASASPSGGNSSGGGTPGDS